MPEVLKFINEYSLYYIRNVTDRQKRGQFPITTSDIASLKKSLQSTIRVCPERSCRIA